MAGEKKGTTTSANDGGYLPDSDGFEMSGPFDFSLVNGTTFSGALQRLYAGSWVKIPDTDSRADLTGAAAFPVNYQSGGRFRVSQTTATGTWIWEATEH